MLRQHRSNAFFAKRATGMKLGEKELFGVSNYFYEI